MKDIDLHVHTSYSEDGELHPKEIIRLAEKNKIKIIAITDHNSVSGIKKALKYAKDKNIIVIPGIEISCKEKNISEVHILGLFIDYKKINCKKILYEKPSIIKAIKIIKNSQGIPILAHPGIYFNKMEEFINIFINGGGEVLEINYPYEKIYNFSKKRAEAIKEKLRKITKENNLIISGGSDFHGKIRRTRLGDCGVNKQSFLRLNNLFFSNFSKNRF